MPRKSTYTPSVKKKGLSPEAAFGMVLRERRTKLGLTQAELESEDGSGIERSYISKLEAGKNQVCLRGIFSLAKSLNTSPEVLMAETMKLLEK